MKKIIIVREEPCAICKGQVELIRDVIVDPHVLTVGKTNKLLRCLCGDAPFREFPGYKTIFKTLEVEA